MELIFFGSIFASGIVLPLFIIFFSLHLTFDSFSHLQILFLSLPIIAPALGAALFARVLSEAIRSEFSSQWTLIGGIAGTVLALERLGFGVLPFAEAMGVAELATYFGHILFVGGLSAAVLLVLIGLVEIFTRWILVQGRLEEEWSGAVTVGKICMLVLILGASLEYIGATLQT